MRYWWRDDAEAVGIGSVTVIAWDGSTLAADRRVTIGGVTFESTKVRCVEGPRGLALVALCGEGARIERLMEWYSAGADPATYPTRKDDDWSALVCITRDDKGQCRIERFEGSGYALIVDSHLYADGGGRDAAMGAMLCGATAVRAVEITSQLIGSCGNGYDAVTFPKDALGACAD